MKTSPSYRIEHRFLKRQLHTSRRYAGPKNVGVISGFGHVQRSGGCENEGPGVSSGLVTIWANGRSWEILGSHRGHL